MSATLKIEVRKPAERKRKAVPMVVALDWDVLVRERWRKVGRAAAAESISAGRECALAGEFLGDVGVLLAAHFGPPSQFAE